MLLVLLLVALELEPDVASLPLADPAALPAVFPLASLVPGDTEEPVVPAVPPLAPIALVPVAASVEPAPAAVAPGWTMAPPLAPRAPPVVAPGPVTEFSDDKLPLLVAEAPDWVPRVELLQAVCA